MIRTFNMEVGMTIVSSPKIVDRMISNAIDNGVNAYTLGRIVIGEGNVNCVNSLKRDY